MNLFTKGILMKQQLNKTVSVLSGLVAKVVQLKQKADNLVSVEQYQLLSDRIDQVLLLFDNTTGGNGGTQQPSQPDVEQPEVDNGNAVMYCVYGCSEQSANGQYYLKQQFDSRSVLHNDADQYGSVYQNANGVQLFFIYVDDVHPSNMEDLGAYSLMDTTYVIGKYDTINTSIPNKDFYAIGKFFMGDKEYEVNGYPSYLHYPTPWFLDRQTDDLSLINGQSEDYSGYSVLVARKSVKCVNANPDPVYDTNGIWKYLGQFDVVGQLYVNQKGNLWLYYNTNALYYDIISVDPRTVEDLNDISAEYSQYCDGQLGFTDKYDQNQHLFLQGMIEAQGNESFSKGSKFTFDF